MAKKVTKLRTLELSTSGVAVLAILLAGLRLSELLPISRSPGGSSQNWRLEIYVSVFLVICGFWIYRNRVEAAAKLASLDKYARLILVCIIGFTIWGALSSIWAYSWAPVLIHTLSWILFIAVFVFSIVLFRTRNGLFALYAGFLIAASITAVLSLVDFYQVTDAARDMGIIRVKYARLAEYFLTVSPLLCIGAVYVRRRPAVIIAVAGWLCSWLVVMLSTSKGAFLAGIVGHVVLFFGCILFTRYPIRKKMALLAGLWLAFTVTTQIAHGALSPLPSTAEFISGEADPTRETTLMRVFTWGVGIQMAAGHPVIGVGANNFGINFNPARKVYFKSHNELSEEMAEYYFPERAHNEFLQIVDELGVIGGLLFAGIFIGFAILLFRNFRSNGYTFSPLLWAAIAGMVAFFASSFVSSFSFRIIQNGVFFFIVFAIAVSEAEKTQKRRAELAERWPSWLLTGSIVGAIAAMFLFGMRGYADLQVRQADRLNPLSKAMPYYASATFFDPENFYIHHRVGVRYAGENQFAGAAQSMRKMIDNGGGTTLNYAVLAEYLANSGQYKSANETFDEAVAIYPNSVFLRVRYATYLEERGQPAEADANMQHATLVNARQANGWYRLLKGQFATNSETDAELTENLLPADARRYYQSKQDNKGAAPVQRYTY